MPAAAAAILLVLVDEAFKGERATALGPVLLAVAAGAALLMVWGLESRRTAKRRAEADELARRAEEESESARRSVREAEQARDEALTQRREAERQARSETERAQRIESREGDEPVLGFGAHAIVDNLTLLYSHRYFHEAAEGAAARAEAESEPFAVVVAELTELPHINRLNRYAAGDEAIRVAAKAVQQAAVLVWRPGDSGLDVVARARLALAPIPAPAA